MRIPEYLSPSSVSLYYKDTEEFYLKYLADERPPRIPQTRPMSIGSAFDAYAKAWISEKLFGEIRGGFDFEELFETQVEPDNRAWAHPNGQWAFDSYKKSGALHDLMVELELADGEPQFEFTVHRDIMGVPLLGKPDLYFKTRNGNRVIYDWKVNGYCSKANTSPKKEYIMVRDGWDYTKGKASRGCFSMHKNCHPMLVKDVTINIASFFESISEEWSAQLAIYAWLMGEEIGSDFVIGIEQLCCKGDGDEMPYVRVASHRSRISAKWQIDLFEKISHIWTAIAINHIFSDMPITESRERQAILNNVHKAYSNEHKDSAWFQDMSRQHRNY